MVSSLDFNQSIVEINQCESLQELENIHMKLFSKAGYFSVQMRELVALSPDKKKEVALLLNQQKNQLLEVFELRTAKIHAILLDEKLASEKLDLSLPVQSSLQGGLHPIGYVIEQCIAIFDTMGFKVEIANEIEEDWYNFTALNIEEHHPARQDHDTFYLQSVDVEGNKKVLRTHTSNTQIRVLTRDKDKLLKGHPIKIIAPGRTYRSDHDATHSPMFHQIEGMLVDKKENISIPQLKSVLSYFCNTFFEQDNMQMRLRSSYFPFTSPSYEVDISYKVEEIKDTQWLEILGSGIVHPKVLENCGIDSDRYSGFAFGMGLERLVMLKYGFNDLRDLFKGNMKWLSHYGFSSVKTPTIFGGLD